MGTLPPLVSSDQMSLSPGILLTGKPIFDSFLLNLTSILEKNYTDQQFGTLELSRKLCLCPMQVHRKIKRRTSLSPGQYLLHFRLTKARWLLEATDLRIGEIAWQTGFTSQNYFARAFRKVHGLTPSEVRLGRL